MRKKGQKGEIAFRTTSDFISLSSNIIANGGIFVWERGGHCDVIANGVLQISVARGWENRHVHVALRHSLMYKRIQWEEIRVILC